jgi:hypothetical protein
MPDATLKKFESPDETMTFDHARTDVVNVGGGTALNPAGTGPSTRRP